MKYYRTAYRIKTFFFLSVIGLSCASRKSDSPGLLSDDMFSLPDTLRVGTLYSPTSFFLYQDEKMGYDYNLIEEFVEKKGLVLDLKIAPSISSLIEMLDSDKVDILAYPIPETSDYKAKVISCGPVITTTQVLVQPRSGHKITDVTQLVGRDIYVEKDSKYHQRISNLNDNLGGGINIHLVDKDTLIAEDLIQMVSDGQLPLTIVDSDIANVNKTYFPGLDISLEVSFPQYSSWAVASSRPWLADSIDTWFQSKEPMERNTQLLKRYFEQSKRLPPSIASITFSNGKMSPIDALFRMCGKENDIDWRLLAAQGFVESRYDSTAVSWAGAKGIMQIMPGTARRFGITPQQLLDNRTSISLAAKILKTLDTSFAPHVPDSGERIKFIIAAYNSGMAHILDAMALAKKYGKNPAVWDRNVEAALMMKSNPQYFNDPVCKYGYFRGAETVRYVKDVFGLYQRACDAIRS